MEILGLKCLDPNLKLDLDLRSYFADSRGIRYTSLSTIEHMYTHLSQLHSHARVDVHGTYMQVLMQ